ncbi:hypothetical protein CDAR_302291 [Caerostris darwini]|uniref:Uncharacterized protein n=1 Tax=Caerostris darwini TaxID=1538125 RepID=A0AAV4VPV1_9ARAC|nr:hypothetical protein CDAR_302291 [Caerostris darwini]
MLTLRFPIRLYRLRYLQQGIVIEQHLDNFKDLEERPKFEPPWIKIKFGWRYMKQRKEGCCIYTDGSKMNGRVGCPMVSVLDGSELTSRNPTSY